MNGDVRERKRVMDGKLIKSHPRAPLRTMLQRQNFAKFFANNVKNKIATRRGNKIRVSRKRRLFPFSEQFLIYDLF